jgi:transposase
MAFILRVAPKLSLQEITLRFRRCRDGAEKTRWQAVMLKREGRSSAEISSICKRSEGWVRQVVNRGSGEGADGLCDGRKANKRARLLSPAQEVELAEAIDGDAPDGGLWTGPKVARWIEATTGAVDVDDSTGNNYLRRLGFSRQVPRPKHPAADPEAQEAFKKGGFKVSFTTSFGPTRAPRSKSGPKTRRGTG